MGNKSSRLQHKLSNLIWTLINKKTGKAMKIIYLLVIMLTNSSLLFAGTLKTDNPERKPKTQVLMTEQQSKKITKYTEMLADERYAEAKSGLTNMLGKTRDRDAYVQSVIYQLLGHIDSTQENYVGAARNFKKSIDLDALPNRTHFGMMLQYAQLLMLGEDNVNGLRALDAYFAVASEIPDSAFAIKANAHAQLEQFRDAKKAIKQAIDLTEKPKESWYQLLLAMHAELSEYSEMADVLSILVTLKPDKKTYWEQLSSVYFTLKRDKKSLAVLELANKNNLLTEEDDYLQLFKLYSYNNIPYKSAAALQKGLDKKIVEDTFKNWKQLGAVWYEAKELDKALAAYANASKYAEDGAIDLTRAYLYVDLEDWNKARSSINSALQKGGLSDNQTGTAWLMLGMTEASLNNYKSAKTAFNKARGYERSRSSAVQWLAHLKTLEKKLLASN